MTTDTNALIEELTTELERAEATIARLVTLLQHAGFGDDLNDAVFEQQRRIVQLIRKVRKDRNVGGQG